MKKIVINCAESECFSVNSSDLHLKANNVKFSFPLAIQIQIIPLRPPVLVIEALYRNENHDPKTGKRKLKKEVIPFLFRCTSLRK